MNSPFRLAAAEFAQRNDCDLRACEGVVAAAAVVVAAAAAAVVVSQAASYLSL